MVWDIKSIPVPLYKRTWFSKYFCHLMNQCPDISLSIFKILVLTTTRGPREVPLYFPGASEKSIWPSQSRLCFRGSCKIFLKVKTMHYLIFLTQNIFIMIKVPISKVKQKEFQKNLPFSQSLPLDTIDRFFQSMTNRCIGYWLLPIIDR